MTAHALSLPRDFEDFVAILNQHGVDVVLVGGYALGVHGFVRATADIDFLYRCTVANVDQLCTALTQFGAPPHLINATALLDPDSVTFFGVPPLRIDLLSSISGVDSEMVFLTALESHVAGLRMLVIGRQALELNKKASGRVKDRRDLRALSNIDRKRAKSS